MGWFHTERFSEWTKIHYSTRCLCLETELELHTMKHRCFPSGWGRTSQMHLYTCTQDFKLHIANTVTFESYPLQLVWTRGLWFPPTNPSFWDRTIEASTSPSWGSSLGPNELRWAQTQPDWASSPGCPKHSAASEYGFFLGLSEK